LQALSKDQHSHYQTAKASHTSEQASSDQVSQQQPSSPQSSSSNSKTAAQKTKNHTLHNQRKQERSPSSPLESPHSKKQKKKQRQEATSSKQQQEEKDDIEMSGNENADELSAALIQQLQQAQASFGAFYNPGARMRT